MASVMGICAGLVGPKSENVEKALVLLLLFEGQRSPEDLRSAKDSSRTGSFDVEKV